MSLKFQHRSNMRGIRKCPQCGTFNGNRASKCKNRSCQQTLKETTSSCIPISAPTVVKLLKTDSLNGHLYSIGLKDGVRNIIRTSNDTADSFTLLSLTNSSEMPHQDTVQQLILACKSIAEAVPLQKEAIDSLAVSEEEKHLLWEKQSYPAGSPLVQRVVNDVFVVGHWQTAYGMHHVTAHKRNQKYFHLHCGCSESNSEQNPNHTNCWHVLAVAAGLLSAPSKYGGDRWTGLLQKFLTKTISPSSNVPDVREDSSAFSFEFFLARDDGQISMAGEHIEMQSMLNSSIMELFNEQEAPETDPMIAESTGDYPPTCIPSIFAGDEESLQLMDCQIELMDELDPTDRIDFCPSYIECADSLLAPDEEPEEKSAPEEKVVKITAKKAALKRCGRLDREKLIRGSYRVRKLMKVLESNGIVFNRLQRRKDGNDDVSSILPYEAIECSLSFTGWLGSVIEQLNSVIDYNRDGRPEVQTFRIQEDFFRCLRARFSVGHHLRQPEAMEEREVEESKNPSQVYKFSHHKSLLHVFRTDEMELCFEKSFQRMADGRYIASNDHEEDSDKNGTGSSGEKIAIRPHCYTTYIKLGRYKHEPDPDRVYHFTIEWIGGVLPRSGFGDMRISFEYGHRMNKQYMPPPPSPVCGTE